MAAAAVQASSKAWWTQHAADWLWRLGNESRRVEMGQVHSVVQSLQHPIPGSATLLIPSPPVLMLSQRMLLSMLLPTETLVSLSTVKSLLLCHSLEAEGV